jgi:hypothetical protein
MLQIMDSVIKFLKCNPFDAFVVPEGPRPAAASGIEGAAQGPEFHAFPHRLSFDKPVDKTGVKAIARTHGIDYFRVYKGRLLKQFISLPANGAFLAIFDDDGLGMVF